MDILVTTETTKSGTQHFILGSETMCVLFEKTYIDDLYVFATY